MPKRPISRVQLFCAAHKKLPPIFIANSLEKKRGVLIAICDTVIFQLLDSVIDSNGRYVILICTIDNITYTLVSLYTPNTRQIHFLIKLIRKDHRVQKEILLLCGDFNLVTDFQLDSTNKCPRTQSPI